MSNKKKTEKSSNKTVSVMEHVCPLHNFLCYVFISYIIVPYDDFQYIHMYPHN